MNDRVGGDGGGCGVVIRGGRTPSLIHGESLGAEQRSAECFVVVFEGVPQSPIYPSPPHPPSLSPIKAPIRRFRAYGHPYRSKLPFPPAQPPYACIFRTALPQHLGQQSVAHIMLGSEGGIQGSIHKELSGSRTGSQRSAVTGQGETKPNPGCAGRVSFIWTERNGGFRQLECQNSTRAKAKQSMCPGRGSNSRSSVVHL